MSAPSTFGDPARYYARQSNIAHHETVPTIVDSTEEMIRELIVQRHNQIQERVEHTTKRQGIIIRELLTRHTALRLSAENSRQSIAVRVVDGLPEPLKDIAAAIPQREIWELLFNRTLLQETIRGLELTDRRLNAIARWRPVSEIAQTGVALRQSRDFIVWLIEMLEQTDILGRLARIDEDTFGAYFFLNQPPTIHLYWMAIGLWAALLDTSVEALTIVTLAHEMAHAFTHIGYDTDRQRWDTGAFAATDIRIIEGLAQFYTEIVCGEFDAKNFGANTRAVFDTLLKIQAPPYTGFSNWGKTAARRQELIRSCLIQCRTEQITDYDVFVRILKNTVRRISPNLKN